eukprot:766211-Hanusia_phi.AAC.1
MNNFWYEFLDEEPIRKTVQATSENCNSSLRAADLLVAGGFQDDDDSVLPPRESEDISTYEQTFECPSKQELPANNGAICNSSPSSSRVARDEQGPETSPWDDSIHQNLRNDVKEIEVCINTLIELHHIRASRSSSAKTESGAYAVMLLTEILTSSAVHNEISTKLDDHVNKCVIDGTIKFTIEQMLKGNSKVILKSSLLLHRLSKLSVGNRSVLYNLAKLEIFEWLKDLLQRELDQSSRDHFTWIVCFVVDSIGPEIPPTDHMCESISQCIISLLKGDISQQNIISLCSAWSKLLAVHLPRRRTKLVAEATPIPGGFRNSGEHCVFPFANVSPDFVIRQQAMEHCWLSFIAAFSRDDYPGIEIEQEV